MQITKDGQAFTIASESEINEHFPKFGVTARYQISLANKDGVTVHTAKGATRAWCFLGLLDQGYEITR